MSDRLMMIESTNSSLSIIRQCDLLGVPRSTYYYEPIPETEYNLMLMQELDKIYLDNPFYGSRLMTASLIRKGFQVNRKRISRLMKVMGIEAMYPKPKRQDWEQRYGKFPYLIKEMDITFQNQVWGTDITYIPVDGGYIYLVAYVDLYSRYVLSWQLSNTLESTFCIEALQSAFKLGKPLIVNSDQGVQFTSRNYITLLQSKNIEISMSGKGRCWDNILVERFWRSLKYEEVYLKQYNNSDEAYEGIGSYIDRFNNERPHSALNYQTPREAHMKA